MTLKGKACFFFAIAFTATCLCAAASWFYVSYMDISTPPPPVVHDPKSEKPRLFFGVISRYPPMEIFRGYQPFMDYLTRKTPYRFELRLSRTYDETVRQIVQGEVDFASVGKYVYIRVKEKHDIQCIARPYYASGNPFFYYTIVVDADSPIKTIQDLKGKSFAFPPRESFSFWETKYLLLKNGISIDDLAYSQNLVHHNTVVEKVIKGEFDAGVVKDIVARKYIDKGIRIIDKVQATGVPIVAAPHVDPETVRTVRDVLLAMKSEIDRSGLQTAGWDEEVAYGFARTEDSDYDACRQLLRHLREAR